MAGVRRQPAEVPSALHLHGISRALEPKERELINGRITSRAGGVPGGPKIKERERELYSRLLVAGPGL